MVGRGADRLRSDFGKFSYDNAHGWKETARYRLTQDGSLNSRREAPVDAVEPATISIWRKIAYKKPSNWSSSGDFLLKSRALDVQPLQFALRPLSLISARPPERWRVISEDARVGEARCIEIQVDELDHSERWWVDRNRDFSVIRWERRQPNASPLDVAIDVSKGRDGEWLPLRWAFQLAQGDGGRPAALAATVTDHSVNDKLPQETFAPVAPAGARVYDVTVDLPIRDSDDRSGWLADEEARTTLHAIADAWTRRQERTKSFKFTWEEENGPTSWNSDSQKRTMHMMCIDGAKFAEEFSSPGWKPPTARPAASSRSKFFGKEGWSVYRSKTGFDGVTKRDLSFCERPGDLGNMTLSSGLHARGSGQPQGNWTLSLVFRPLDPIFGRFNPSDLRDPSKYHVLARGGKIGDVACVIMETEPNPGMQQSYWLDPARDYLPLREHRTLNGEDRDRVELSYRLDPAQGWVPMSWRETFVGEGGAALIARTDTVISYRVNQPFPASEFELETPKGARVNDMREGTDFAHRNGAATARQQRMAAKMNAHESKKKPKPKPKAVYDPFADAAADVEAAIKQAQETHRRVLIEFGANWCPGCRDLGVVLKENAEVASALKKGFVLVLVDTDFDSGKKTDEKYVPRRQRNSIPHLAVLDASGNVLTNDDTESFADGDDFDVAKIQAFLAKWSP